MCEHKNVRCSLIQTIDGHHREDVCKDCGEQSKCGHFDLSKQVFKFDTDYFSSGETDELSIDDLETE